MTAEIRYAPDSEYGKRFPTWVVGSFPDSETAESVRAKCPNGDSMEVVEVPA